MRVDILVSFLILEEMLSVLRTENDVCCGFVIYGLYYVEIYSLYTHFDESFYYEWMLNLSNAFSASIEMIMVFVFSFVDVVHHID